MSDILDILWKERNDLRERVWELEKELEIQVKVAKIVGRSFDVAHAYAHKHNLALGAWGRDVTEVVVEDAERLRKRLR